MFPEKKSSVLLGVLVKLSNFIGETLVFWQFSILQSVGLEGCSPGEVAI